MAVTIKSIGTVRFISGGSAAVLEFSENIAVQYRTDKGEIVRKVTDTLQFEGTIHDLVLGDEAEDEEDETEIPEVFTKDPNFGDFPLRPSTAAILDYLRQSTGGRIGADRQSGKTTALLLRALELTEGRQAVTVVVPTISLADTTRDVLRSLTEGTPLGAKFHPHLVFIVAASKTRIMGRVLVDELDLISEELQSSLPHDAVCVTSSHYFD